MNETIKAEILSIAEKRGLSNGKEWVRHIYTVQDLTKDIKRTIGSFKADLNFSVGDRVNIAISTKEKNGTKYTNIEDIELLEEEAPEIDEVELGKPKEDRVHPALWGMIFNKTGKDLENTTFKDETAYAEAFTKKFNFNWNLVKDLRAKFKTNGE